MLRETIGECILNTLVIVWTSSSQSFEQVYRRDVYAAYSSEVLARPSKHHTLSRFKNHVLPP